MASKRQRRARLLLGAALLIFAGILVGVLVFRRSGSRGATPTFVSGGSKQSSPAMWEGIDFVRTEGDRKLFQVKAKQHYLDEKGFYQLRGGLEIRIFAKDASENAFITADGGYYDREFAGLYLDGNVKAKLATGLKLSTASLRYVKEKDLIRSSDVVKFERGDVSGRGTGFTVDVAEKVVEFIHKIEFDVANIRPDLPALTHIQSKYMLYNDRTKFGIFQDGVEVTNADSSVRSEEVEFALTEDGGHLKEMTARFGVQVDYRGASRGAGRIQQEGDRSLSSVASGPGEKTLKAEKAYLIYAAEGRLAEATADGKAVMEVLRRKDDKVIYRRQLSGDWVHFNFFKDKDGVERCEAKGDVKVEIFEEGKSRKDRVQKRVFCNALTAQFDPLTEEASSMLFTGKVRFEDQGSAAFGEKGTYDGRQKSLIITEGNPRVEREGSIVSAQKIEINESTGALKATGGAKTVYARRSGEISFFSNAEEPVSMSASTMTYDPDTGVALFTTDARAWQGDNIITASVIKVDQGQNTFAATTGVKSVLFSTVPKKGQAGERGEKERVPITVTSDQLLYTEAARSMTYTSNVVLHREEADMKSDRCEVFFQKKVNDIENMLATGNVVITQPGKQIMGQNADYDVPKDMVTITGKPKLIDIIRGTSQGKSLTYFFGDGKVILDGKMEGRTTTVYQPEIIKR